MKNKRFGLQIFLVAAFGLLASVSQAQVVKCKTADGRTIYGDESACTGTGNTSVVSARENVSAVKRQNALSQNNDTVDVVNLDADPTASNVVYEKPVEAESFEKPHIEHLNPAVERLTPRKILARKKQRLSDLYETD